MKPVVVVTNHVPPDRAGAFRALHARTPIELALFGGRSTHATGGLEDPGVPHRHVAQRDVLALAASGRHRAVVAGTAGRVALPAAYVGARRGRVPFVLWTALWAPLRAPQLLPSVPLLAHLYRHADAVATYGEHVSAYVRARGARRVHVAPQAVDNAFWSAAAERPPGSDAGFRVLFVGRPDREKGLEVLAEAWRRARLRARDAELVVVGADPGELPQAVRQVARAAGRHPPAGVRNFYATAAVVAVPSIPTPDFREPWGLVANEAMNQRVPILATDAVGAAAGGLVRHERNGLVVPAGDAGALAAGLERLASDEALRTRLGEAAARDVAAFTHEAWAAGMSAAIQAASRASDRRKDYR
jgi:glycosyltransferase involved in cell wall biosynthesis